MEGNMDGTNSSKPMSKHTTADIQLPAPSPITLNPKSDNAPTQNDVSSINLTDFLDIEDRPAFILDLRSATKGNPVYCNPSLRKLTVLEAKIRKGASAVNVPRDPGHTVFLEWALSSHPSASDRLYSGLRWVAKTIKNRWRIIFGDVDAIAEIDPFHTRRQSEIPRLGRAHTASLDIASKTFESQLKAYESSRDELIQQASTLFPNVEDMPSPEPLGISLDFTRPFPGARFTSHVQFVCDFDWASTELGPMRYVEQEDS